MNQLPTWHDVIGEEKQQSYFVDTLNFVEAERAAGKAIYPPAKDVFNAFRFTEFKDVKVVILGQDPYHGPNQAHGLCFSVLPGIKTPPSLVNMYKELAQDIEGFQIPQHGFFAKLGRARCVATKYRIDGRAGQSTLALKNGLGNLY